MSLPYDIARCAGERNRTGSLVRQCIDCARHVYSKPPHCNPHWQAWMNPHHAASSGNCPAYIGTNR